jgi:spore coat polysaccharide biosynthesis protein SpsF
MKTIIVSQARMTSTRLPGKVLLKVLDKSLLEYHIERLQRVKLADEVIIATTINLIDDPIVELCKKLNIKYFRGSENNVLSRYFKTAELYRASIIVRVTSDCPVIDPQIVDDIIEFYLKNINEYDYVSNSTLDKTFPRGLDVEVFSFNALKEAQHRGKKQIETEHVTPYIHQNPDKFRLGSVTNKINLSKHRWTVDEQADFDLIKIIIENLYPKNKNFTMQDILQLFKENPKLIEINKNVKQKIS